MATIRPFKAVRPNEKVADKVAALPYDVMSSMEAREMTKDNPISFLYIDRAEINFEPGVNIYDDKVYKMARQVYEDRKADGTFIQDCEPCLYIYRQTMDGRSQLGLVACASIDDYINNHIKKHELTREEKEQDRIKHVDNVNANTGPIFLTYRHMDELSKVIKNWSQSHKPVYDFVAEDNIGHTVWVIDDKETIDAIVESFKNIPSLYIADGHHRNASAVKVGLRRREENPGYSPEAEFNYYLSVIFPDNELYIMDYNRIVKDLNGNSKEEFLNKVSEKFTVTEYQSEGPCHPQKAHTFGMYLDKKWYLLEAKEEYINKNDVVASLDVSILQNELLNPVLGIEDPRTDNRIDFVGGLRGLKELEKRVDSGEMTVAFAMYPTTIEELMNIADADKLMPPKSTWFEPKLRSGLLIHELD